MKHLLFLTTFIFCISSYSQLDIRIWNENKLEIDWKKECNLASKDTNLIHIIGLSVSRDSDHSGLTYITKWLEPYDVSKFKITFYIVDSEISKNFDVIHNDGKTKTEYSLLRSNLFVINKNVEYESFLIKQRLNLSLEKLSLDTSFLNGYNIYQFNTISNTSDFEWKTNHLIYNLSKIEPFLPEKKKTKIEKLNVTALQLNVQIHGLNNFTSGLDGLALSSSSVLNYGVQLERNFPVNNEGLRFATNLAARFYRFSIGTTMDSLQMQWLDSSMNGPDLLRNNKVVGLKETWKANDVPVLFVGTSCGYSFNDMFSLTAGFEYGQFFPFKLQSKLMAGTFSYRAKVAGVDDELVQINSLGLAESISYADLSSQDAEFSGNTLRLNLTIKYNISSTFFLSIQAAYEKINLVNRDYNEQSMISANIGDFNSTLFNTKNIKMNCLTIGASIGINF
jgi:hypothetical protein